MQKRGNIKRVEKKCKSAKYTKIKAKKKCMRMQKCKCVKNERSKNSNPVDYWFIIMSQTSSGYSSTSSALVNFILIFVFILYNDKYNMHDGLSLLSIN